MNHVGLSDEIAKPQEDSFMIIDRVINYNPHVNQMDKGCQYEEMKINTHGNDLNSKSDLISCKSCKNFQNENSELKMELEILNEEYKLHKEQCSSLHIQLTQLFANHNQNNAITEVQIEHLEQHLEFYSDFFKTSFSQIFLGFN